MPRQDLLESRFGSLLPLTTYTVNQSAKFTLLVLSVGLIIPCMPHASNSQVDSFYRPTHETSVMRLSQAKLQVADTTHFNFHRHTFNLYDLVGVEEGHLAEVKVHLQLLLPTLPVCISLKVRCMHLLSSAFADSRSVWKRTKFWHWN